MPRAWAGASLEFFACRRPHFSLPRQRKVSKRKARVPRQVSACWPSYFLLLRQKKVTKEKASQRPSPCGVPCSTRGARGRAQTRYAQTSARPDPRTAALLSTADGLGAPNTACARSLRSPCTGGTRVDAQTPHRRRIRTKHRAIDYNRIVSQSWPTNPHRNLTHRHPYPAKNKQIGCSSSPSPPEGVKGRGGSGGQNSEGQASGG